MNSFGNLYKVYPPCIYLNRFLFLYHTCCCIYFCACKLGVDFYHITLFVHISSLGVVVVVVFVFVFLFLVNMLIISLFISSYQMQADVFRCILLEY